MVCGSGSLPSMMNMDHTTLFVGYPGKEQDAHAESQGKGYHLERNAFLSVNQGLDNVVNLFHVFMDSVFRNFLSFQLPIVH